MIKVDGVMPKELIDKLIKAGAKIVDRKTEPPSFLVVGVSAEKFYELSGERVNPPRRL